MATTWKPDPTFYPSPKLAMEAPQEEIAYVAILNPERNGRPDALGVLDVAPRSSNYGQLISRLDFPYAGDELHHFGFEKVAGKTAVSFSGYANDPREIFEIPEVRAYWQRLDQQLPELPALLTHIPHLRYNGPGMQLELLGTVDLALPDPAIGGYHLHVVEGETIIADAFRRIRQAGAKYHLRQDITTNLAARFVQAATAELEPPTR